MDGGVLFYLMGGIGGAEDRSINVNVIVNEIFGRQDYLNIHQSR